MRKKLVALLLVTGLAAASFAGCGNSPAGSGSGESQSSSSGAESNTSQEASPAPAGTEEGSGAITFPLAETKNFSMYVQINGETPMEDVDAFQYLNEQSNITFDVNSVSREDAKEKEGLLLASGDYPDVFIYSTLNKNDVEKYGSEGVFVPLEEHIRTQAPNLTKLLDDGGLWPYITASDGHIYAMPALNTGAELESGWHVWLDNKWLDNVGLTEPRTLEELHTVLTAFKEQDANGNGDLNDEIPLSVMDGIDSLKHFLPYFGYRLDSGTWLAEKNGELTYIPTSDGYKEFLQYFTTLYQEGILDPASFTQNYDQLAAVGGSADVLGCFVALASFQFVGREIDRDFTILTPFEGQDYPMSTGIFYSCMMITDACDDPATLVAWADQLYSQEGGMLYWLGVEGNAYIMNDDGTWAWNVGGPFGSEVAKIREKGNLKHQTAFPGVQPDIWFTGITDPSDRYLNDQRARMLEYGKINLPAMSYSTEQTETIVTLKPDLDSYIKQYGAQVITGALDLDSSWEEYVSTMNTMGASTLFEIYQSAFDQAVK